MLNQAKLFIAVTSFLIVYVLIASITILLGQFSHDVNPSLRNTNSGRFPADPAASRANHLSGAGGASQVKTPNPEPADSSSAASSASRSDDEEGLSSTRKSHANSAAFHANFLLNAVGPLLDSGNFGEILFSNSSKTARQQSTKPAHPSQGSIGDTGALTKTALQAVLAALQPPHPRQRRSELPKNMDTIQFWMIRPASSVTSGPQLKNHGANTSPSVRSAYATGSNPSPRVLSASKVVEIRPHSDLLRTGGDAKMIVISAFGNPDEVLRLAIPLLPDSDISQLNALFGKKATKADLLRIGNGEDSAADAVGKIVKHADTTYHQLTPESLLPLFLKLSPDQRQAFVRNFRPDIVRILEKAFQSGNVFICFADGSGTGHTSDRAIAEHSTMQLEGVDLHGMANTTGASAATPSARNQLNLAVVMDSVVGSDSPMSSRHSAIEAGDEVDGSSDATPEQKRKQEALRIAIAVARRTLGESYADSAECKHVEGSSFVELVSHMCWGKLVDRVEKGMESSVAYDALVYLLSVRRTELSSDTFEALVKMVAEVLRDTSFAIPDDALDTIPISSWFIQPDPEGNYHLMAPNTEGNLVPVSNLPFTIDEAYISAVVRYRFNLKSSGDVAKFIRFANRLSVDTQENQILPFVQFMWATSENDDTFKDECHEYLSSLKPTILQKRMTDGANQYTELFENESFKAWLDDQEVLPSDENTQIASSLAETAVAAPGDASLDTQIKKLAKELKRYFQKDGDPIEYKSADKNSPLEIASHGCWRKLLKSSRSDRDQLFYQKALIYMWVLNSGQLNTSQSQLTKFLVWKLVQSGVQIPANVDLDQVRASTVSVERIPEDKFQLRILSSQDDGKTYVAFGDAIDLDPGVAGLLPQQLAGSSRPSPQSLSSHLDGVSTDQLLVLLQLYWGTFSGGQAFSSAFGNLSEAVKNKVIAELKKDTAGKFAMLKESLPKKWKNQVISA